MNTITMNPVAMIVAMINSVITMGSRYDDFYSNNPGHWSHPAPWNNK